MARNFSVNQYEQEFNPKRLQMYEVPKVSLSEKPKQNNSKQGSTVDSQNVSFIADNKGHLLPGVPRNQQSQPFGDYVGTWDLPKSVPGPYHLVRTGRTDKNVCTLYQKKEDANVQINLARENKKPVALQSNGNSSCRCDA